VIDLDPAFQQQLLDVSVRQAILQIPPDRHQDHLRWKPEPDKTGPGWWHPNLTTAHRPTLPEPVIDQRNPVETLATLIARFRHRIAETEETDLVTQDLLITVSAGLEKAHWMWQAQLAS
jgi:hypothetical protein